MAENIEQKIRILREAIGIQNKETYQSYIDDRDDKAGAEVTRLNRYSEVLDYLLPEEGEKDEDFEYFCKLIEDAREKVSAATDLLLNAPTLQELIRSTDAQITPNLGVTNEDSIGPGVMNPGGHTI